MDRKIGICLRRFVSTVMIVALTLSVEMTMPEDVKAYSYVELYLTVGEEYTKTVSTKKPVFNAYGSEDKEVVAASWDTDVVADRTKFTVKAKSPGTATFYICKNNNSSEDTRVTTVKVHVYYGTGTNALNLSNNTSKTNGTNLNVPIYLYTGKRSTCTASLAYNWPASVSGDSSGKAVALTTTWSSDNSSVATVSGGVVTGIKQGTANITCTKQWTTSCGNIRKETRTIRVYVYNVPYLIIYEDGKAITSKTINTSTRLNLTYAVYNMQTSDTIKSATCTSADTNKFTVSTSNGVYVITPRSVTNGAAVNAVFNIVISSQVSAHNGDSAATLIKSIPINIVQDTTVKVTSVDFQKDEIKVEKGASVSNPAIVLPSDATNKEVAYNSVNENVATVDNSGIITGVEPGITKVSAVSKSDATKNSECTVRVLPVKTSISSIMCDRTGVRVEWNKSDDAETYKIYRSINVDGSYSLIGTSSGTTYIDTTTKLGTKYYYKVTVVPVEASCESDYSASKSIYFNPVAPKTSIISAGVVSNGINVKWKSVDDASVYGVYRSNSANGTYTKIAETEGVEYTDTDTKHGVTYYYKISVIPTEGSTYESEKSSGVSCKRVPETPQIKKVSSAYGQYQVEIKGTLYDGFSVYQGSSESKVSLLTITSTKYATISLKPGVYYLKIKAYVTVDGKKVYSDYSDSVKIVIGSDNKVTTNVVVKRAKIKKAVRSKNGKSIKIKIKKIAGVKGYKIKYSTSRKFKKSKTTTIKTTKRIKTIKKLKAKKTYYIKVRAYKKVKGVVIQGKWSKVKIVK